jgi:hypothetical protein
MSQSLQAVRRYFASQGNTKVVVPATYIYSNSRLQCSETVQLSTKYMLISSATKKVITLTFIRLGYCYKKNHAIYIYNCRSSGVNVPCIEARCMENELFAPLDANCVLLL